MPECLDNRERGTMLQARCGGAVKRVAAKPLIIMALLMPALSLIRI